MASLAGINQNVAPAEDFELIPVGDYKAVIESEEVKSSKSGNGDYLSLKVKIIDGVCKNRVLYTILNLWNRNEKAAEIAARELAAIKAAAGKPMIDDTRQLQNIPLSIRVAHEHSEQWGDKAVIKGWKSLAVAPTAGGIGKPTTPPTSSPTSSGSSDPREFTDEIPF